MKIMEYKDKVVIVTGGMRSYIFIFAAILFAFIACTNAPKANNGAKTSAQKQAGKETSLSLNEELHKGIVMRKFLILHILVEVIRAQKTALLFLSRIWIKMELLIFTKESASIPTYTLNHARIL